MKISLKLAVFSIAAVLVYLGLAILGLGGFAAFLSHPALVIIALATDRKSVV